MMNNVLVVDSNKLVLNNLTNLLNGQGGFFHVHSARNGRQALDIMQTCTVKIVITAIRLPEMDGLMLLKQLAKLHPETKVIVMTGPDMPTLKSQIIKYPSAIYLDHTHDLSMLTKRVFTELQIDYGGQVRGINLTSFIQMMALEGVNCELKVSSKDQSGFLWLDGGEIVAARLPEESGRSAAMKILTWKNVFIDINYSPRQMEQEITEPLMMLMLESSQMEDELRNENANKRRYKRHDLLVAIDFDIHNTRRHCALWDICQGGAYIETDHEINIGECIILWLNSPILKSTCTVGARVVRKDRNGIGVEFLPTNLHQQKIIKAMISGSTAPFSLNDQTGDMQGLAVLS